MHPSFSPAALQLLLLCSTASDTLTLDPPLQVEELVSWLHNLEADLIESVRERQGGRTGKEVFVLTSMEYDCAGKEGLPEKVAEVLRRVLGSSLKHGPTKHGKEGRLPPKAGHIIVSRLSPGVPGRVKCVVEKTGLCVSAESNTAHLYCKSTVRPTHADASNRSHSHPLAGRIKTSRSLTGSSGLTTRLSFTTRPTIWPSAEWWIMFTTALSPAWMSRRW